jgi:hypothetical protein
LSEVQEASPGIGLGEVLRIPGGGIRVAGLFIAALTDLRPMRYEDLPDDLKGEV